MESLKGAADISVIIPAFGHCPHLLKVLDALETQSLRPAEIIIVHSGPDDPTDELRHKKPAVMVIHSDSRLYAGAARNLGAENAATPWLAFLDSDVRPVGTWLESLLKSAESQLAQLVVGSVAYAVTGGYWGLCLWATEFSGQFPHLKSEETERGASANMVVSADAFAQAGGFPDDIRIGEDTVLFARLRQMGIVQWFASDAEVQHYNIGGFLYYARHLFPLGKSSALCRRRYALQGHIVTKFWVLAPGLWLARLYLISKRSLGKNGLGKRFLACLLPGIMLGVIIWNIGFILGLFMNMPAGFNDDENVSMNASNRSSVA